MSNEEMTIEEELDLVYEKIGYLSTLLSMVVQQAGGTITIDPEIPLENAQGIKIEPVVSGKWVIKLDIE